MGERFVVVAWNGDVYPCSHLRGTEYKMGGNVKEQPFRDICETSYAFTRTQLEPRRAEGHCGSCIKRESCGGCRAIMWHTTGNMRAADTRLSFRGVKNGTSVVVVVVVIVMSRAVLSSHKPLGPFGRHHSTQNCSSPPRSLQ